MECLIFQPREYNQTFTACNGQEVRILVALDLVAHPAARLCSNLLFCVFSDRADNVALCVLLGKSMGCY